MSRMPVEIGDVEAAAAVLRGVANRTPLVSSRTLDGRTGATVFLKMESFQRSGAFKFRGAYNKISSLTPDALQRGVAAFSSGNHAQAVAIATRILGSKALILMPADAPPEKRDATLGYGAEVVEYDRYAGGDRSALGAALADDRGLTLVPPYDDPLIMAGQGTAGLELLEEGKHLDHLLVPVGGGGLISGCSTAAKALLPSISVFGVEPETADDTRRSLEAGERITIPVPRTIADGLQSEAVGELTFEVIRQRVDGILTVTEDEIVDAMAFLFERMKLVVEPSGAVPVAALLAGKVDGIRGRRVGVIVSGGNIGTERFARILADRPPRDS